MSEELLVQELRVAIRAENERLREALEKIAAEQIEPPDQRVYYGYWKTAQRIAKAALKRSIQS